MADKDKADDEKPSRVQVYVRVRPAKGAEESAQSCVEVDPACALVSVSTGEAIPKDVIAERKEKEQGGDAVANPTDKMRRESSGEEDVNIIQYACREFTFDGAFTPNATQSDVFMQVGWPVLRGCLKGINGTVLAYGQTGSGKTYSLLNTEQDMESVGILPCLVASLFVHITHDSGSVYRVEAAALQVYNEQIDDLMHPQHQAGGGHGLTVQNGGQVPGLTWVRCDTPVLLLDAFLLARSNVVYADTLLNKVASRSHAVFQLRITRSPKGDADNFTHARLNVVDLAGSERVKKSGVQGAQMKESMAINKSLLAFGNVVSALAAKKTHVPIRDSKLTRILDGSIGGNCKTALLVCASPSSENMHETLNSLEFASRAMRVEVDLRVNRGFLGVNTKTLMKDLSDDLKHCAPEQSKEHEVLSLHFPATSWPAPLQFEDAFWRALGNLWAARLSELVRLHLRPHEGGLSVEVLAPHYIIKELNQLSLASLNVMGHTAASVEIWHPETKEATAEVRAEVQRLRRVLEEEGEDEVTEEEEEPAPEEPPPARPPPPAQGQSPDPTASTPEVNQKRSVSFAPSARPKPTVSSVEAVERAVERAEQAVESAERSAEEWRSRAEAAEAQVTEVETQAQESQKALEQWRLRAGIAEAAVEVMQQLQNPDRRGVVVKPPTPAGSTAPAAAPSAIQPAAAEPATSPHSSPVPVSSPRNSPAAQPPRSPRGGTPGQTPRSSPVQAQPSRSIVPVLPIRSSTPVPASSPSTTPVPASASRMIAQGQTSSARSSPVPSAQAQDPRFIEKRGGSVGVPTIVDRRPLPDPLRRRRLSGATPEAPVAVADGHAASSSFNLSGNNSPPGSSPNSLQGSLSVGGVITAKREVSATKNNSHSAREPMATADASAAAELAHLEADLLRNKALLREQKRQLLGEQRAVTSASAGARLSGASNASARSYVSLREPQLLSDLEDRTAVSASPIQRLSPATASRQVRSARSLHEVQHLPDEDRAAVSASPTQRLTSGSRQVRSARSLHDVQQLEQPEERTSIAGSPAQRLPERLVAGPRHSHSAARALHDAQLRGDSEERTSIAGSPAQRLPERLVAGPRHSHSAARALHDPQLRGDGEDARDSPWVNPHVTAVAPATSAATRAPFRLGPVARGPGGPAIEPIKRISMSPR